eukprot:s3666_g4.t1
MLGATWPQSMPLTMSTSSKPAGEERYVAFSEGNDKEEFVIQTLSGDFVVKGENHGRPYYQKLPARPGTAPPEVYVYYWDGRDGASFEGWWFGKASGSDLGDVLTKRQQYDCCNSAEATTQHLLDDAPDSGACVHQKILKQPEERQSVTNFVLQVFAGLPGSITADLCGLSEDGTMDRTDKVKRENSERAGRAKVMEQEATHVINAAQKAADEAKATCERDHGSLDPTLLKETEAALKPHLQALLDQLKVLETCGLGDAIRAVELGSEILRAGRMLLLWCHVRSGDIDSQVMRVQHEKQSEQRDEKLLKEMLASIMEKFHEAEDLVEKAEITSAMIEHAGDDLAEAQKAAEQTEERSAFSVALELGHRTESSLLQESAKQAAAAVKEALTAIGLKLGMLKQFESDQGRLKATDSLGTFREKLRVANQKLLPFLAAQDTFKAQVEAKNLADEMEAKLMPAEVEVERAETIAEPLLNFAEAALAAGRRPRKPLLFLFYAIARKAKAKEKESSKPAKKKSEKHELPTAEVVALAAKHASEAAVNLQGVQKLLDLKRSLDAKEEAAGQLFRINSTCPQGSNQQVLFSTPMKKVLEKVETRIKNGQKKLDRIKIAQKELRERETSTALVSDVAEKMDSVAKAIKEAKTAVDEAQGEEEDTSDTTMATSVTFHSCKPQFFGPLPKEALKTAGRAAALAKVAISMKLLEVKRFTAEAGIQAQRSLQEHQQSLQGSLAEIEVLKKKAAEQKEVSKRKEANRKVAEAEALAEKADQTSAPIFDDEKLATMSALDIRQAGDLNQKAYKAGCQTALNRDLTRGRHESEPEQENAAELAAEYAKLQARLRQAEANVSHCASLPEPVQKQLVLKGFIDEVESKVKAAEGKVETAEQSAKEAEEKPLPEQEEPALPQAQKATAAKSAPWSKGKGGGKRDEKEVVLGPVDKAKAALEVAKMDLKLALRFLEDGFALPNSSSSTSESPGLKAHTQQGKLPEEDPLHFPGTALLSLRDLNGQEAADLRERIEVARTRLDVVSASVERAAEKKGILQLLGDADKKVLEAEKAVEAAAELADKKPGKSSGEKTADDGKAEEKDEADDTKEEEKVKDEEIKAEEDGCKMFGVFAGVCMKEPTMCDAKDNLQNSGKCMLQAARNKGKRVADRTERKRRRRLWRKLLQQGAPDGDQGLGLTAASRQLSNAKTTLAVKRISAKRLPGNAPAQSSKPSIPRNELDPNAAVGAPGAIPPQPAPDIPGIPSALTQAMPGTAAFDMAASLMSAMPGFDASAWAGIAFPSFALPPASAPDLSQQLKEAQAMVVDRSKDKDSKGERGDKVDRKKAPLAPQGGDVLRLRGLPWSAGPPEVAQFLHEYGVSERDVTMCVTESGRQDGHAWVVFQSREVAKKAMQDAFIFFAALSGSLAEKQRQTIGGRFIELFQWKDHSKEKSTVANTTRLNERPPSPLKVYTGILKHFDAQRKCGYIHSQDAEADIGKQDIYAFKDVLERGKACVGDTLAFPLHWSPKGQPQASSPLIRISAKSSYAHTGNFKLLPADMSGRQAGLIECAEVNQVFGRTVYVSPSLAVTLTTGTFVAFNCYLASMPAAFARAPLDGSNVPVCSQAIMVETSFVSPGPELNETKTAEGFDRNPGMRDAGGLVGQHRKCQAACLEQLDALQKRLDAAMRRLAEVRRGSTDRQYAKARKAAACTS